MQIYNYPVDTNGSIFSTNAFTTSSPGYNFFMIASDNIINQYVICYDPIIKSISSSTIIFFSLAPATPSPAFPVGDFSIQGFPSAGSCWLGGWGGGGGPVAAPVTPKTGFLSNR